MEKESPNEDSHVCAFAETTSRETADRERAPRGDGTLCVEVGVEWKEVRRRGYAAAEKKLKAPLSMIPACLWRPEFESGCKSTTVYHLTEVLSKVPSPTLCDD